MDSSEEPSTVHTPTSGGKMSYDISVGGIFAFVVMGAFPVLVVAWVIRKLLIRSHNHITDTRHKHQHPLRQINHNLMRHVNNHADNLDTSTGSIRSCKLSSNEFQNDSVAYNTADKKVELEEATSELSRFRMSPIARSMTTTTHQSNDGLLENTQKVDDKKDSPTDGDDTIAARLYENCVRLQQSIQSQIFPKTITIILDSQQIEARVNEYRRACRPKRVYFDEVVPSDIELGIIKDNKKKKSMCINSNFDDDLLNPSTRDLGIISRYFGTSKRNDEDNDSRCPNNTSISSSSSSSSGISVSDSETDSNGNYDWNLYLHEDVLGMGELVDI